MAEPNETPTDEEAASAGLFVSEDDVERAVEELLTDADERRAAGLQTLALVRRARVPGLEREFDRAESRDDPHAAALGDLVAATEEVAQYLRAEARRAQIVQPTLTEGASVLHGHVVDERGDPVHGVDVHLVDRSGRRIRNATVSTDAAGYFELEWTPPTPKRGEPEPVVRLRVAAGTSRVLYEEPKPRPRAVGTVEYMEIAVEEANS
jgi:hypothetical protein